ncbi:energy-coupling factor transporter ATPase [Alloiococcus sp. CFN-8]|uniref:energy-coupling factor transporter ATPase n=1 Tax=Alloiococcus sp. CFN-8 TaxID=3416081 RepID=UPI003CF91B79
MKKAMIKFDKVSYSYPASEEGQVNRLALQDVSFTIYEGEFVVILGHNGSGKSTAAKHMNSLLVPTEGKVYINDLDSSIPNNTWDIRKNCGMVFQNPDNQMVATIVEEDVAFGPENLGVEPSEIRKRVDDSLKKVGMYEYRRHAPHLLSGGQKQRIAIAGILAMMPKCIVLDEPTAMLDPSGRKEVIKTIKDINKNLGITVILITHYMDEAAEADRIILMDEGRIITEGKPREVLTEVETMKNIGLDVPQVTELAYELAQSGIKIQKEILNVDEMVSALCQLK